MKKLLLILLLAPFIFSACQVDEPGVNQEVDVNLMFDLDTLATRVGESFKGGLANLSDATYDLRYTLEIYPKDEKNGEITGEKIQKLQKIVTNFTPSPNTTMSIRLLPGHYQFVIFADFVEAVQRGVIHADLNYSTDDLSDITFLQYNINDESRDFYYISSEVEIKVDHPIQAFMLQRPLAKLRVVSTDATKYNKCQSVKVEYTTAPISGFNALEGKAITSETHTTRTFTAAVPTTYINDASGEKTLFTDYILVNDETDLQFSFITYSTAADAQQPVELHTYQFNSGVTLRRNALTTIKGSI